jgi:transposase-like protein
MTDVPDQVQRWTAKRKAAIVLSIVKGETSAAEAARKHGLTLAGIERWKEQSFAAGENALRARSKDEEAANGMPPDPGAGVGVVSPRCPESFHAIRAE